MEKTNEIARSEIWNKIYGIIKILPIEKTSCDSLDVPSITTSIEELFLKSSPMVVKRKLNVNYFVSVLKKSLDSDNVKVEFENKDDNINYILDVCNSFKKELEKQSE